MKVLLRKNISKLGKIGDVVEVKPGYARNYLLPQGLGTEPTEANLRAIEADKQRYLEELAKQHAEVEARAELVQGKEITIFARANEEGHLYGSVGPAQLVAALAAEGVFIEPEYIVLDEPIRLLDKYDVTIRFTEEVTAQISVWVVRVYEDGEEVPEPPADEAPKPADEPSAPAEKADEPTPDES